jgi:hypothetical protein
VVAGAEVVDEEEQLVADDWAAERAAELRLRKRIYRDDRGDVIIGPTVCV